MKRQPTTYAQAREMAKDGPVSIALIQRRLGVGYRQAAQFVERLQREKKP